MADGVVILGAGAGGKFAKEILEAEGKAVAGYLDNFVERGCEVVGAPVLGGWELLENPEFVARHGFLVTIGQMHARIDACALVRSRGGKLVNAIHPMAVVSSYATIGEGVLINATAHVLPDAVIGNNVLIEGHCSVGVDCVIEDHVLFGTGVQINGASRIRRGTFMGACSVVIPKVTVGEGCYVGAGAVVCKDLTAGKLAVGVPARVIKDSPWPWRQGAVAGEGQDGC